MLVAVAPLKVVGMLDIPNELSFEDKIRASLAGPAPRTIDELRSRTGDIFWCMQGQPRAYMEIPAGQGATPPYVRGIYRSYKYAARGRRADFEAILCAALWQHLKDFYHHIQQWSGGIDQYLLFWRAVPHIEELEGVHYATGTTGFDANGSPTEEGPTGPLTTIRMRLWVPGVWGTEPQCYQTEPIYVN